MTAHISEHGRHFLVGQLLDELTQLIPLGTHTVSVVVATLGRPARRGHRLAIADGNHGPEPRDRHPARACSIVDPTSMANWPSLIERLTHVSGPVHMPWTDLESLVGGLPPSAAKHRAWWTGDRPHVRAWRAAGFTIYGLVPGQEVTFVPVAEASTARNALAGARNEPAQPADWRAGPGQAARRTPPRMIGRLVHDARFSVASAVVARKHGGVLFRDEVCRDSPRGATGDDLPGDEAPRRPFGAIWAAAP
jgi:hypothetical protein